MERKDLTEVGDEIRAGRDGDYWKMSERDEVRRENGEGGRTGDRELER